MSYLLSLLFSVTAWAGELSPREILDAMCDAMQNQSYRGTFVYLHDNKMESMEVVRRKDERGDIEKILSLNGEAREIIRDDDVVTCILPSSGKVTIDKSRPRSQLPLALPQNLDGVENFYVLTLEGEERVAGQDCLVVSMLPRDGYRYGHRLWVARDSKMMVKSDLLDERGMPIEQIMFTQLALGGDLPDELFEPTLDSEGFKQVEIGKTEVHNGHEYDLKWQATQVPQGFALVSHDHQTSMATGKSMEHLVFSDGMASVSVFVEPYQEGERALNGASRMGAMNAYGRVAGQHKILVVGEVPAATVMLINKHVERVD